MAKATTNIMNPPVYQAYTLFSCCLKAALLDQEHGLAEIEED